ncbi:hypothetical protein [Streptomyces albicerus]|uniref:hypothetical protein n=1 Tax=Streptomyces albicerus TaxID=2569859 RepID=UPI00124B54EF|nr:hypothetical protein [Streptomyces albicerus]
MVTALRAHHSELGAHQGHPPVHDQHFLMLMRRNPDVEGRPWGQGRQVTPDIAVVEDPRAAEHADSDTGGGDLTQHVEKAAQGLRHGHPAGQCQQDRAARGGDQTLGAPPNPLIAGIGHRLTGVTYPLRPLHPVADDPVGGPPDA